MTVETNTSCKECITLQEEFAKNPGGKPMSNKGLALVAVTGNDS